MLPTKHILENGIRVLLTPMEGTEAVTAMILVKAGSRCENEMINGLAHFQEHMFFKGGKKYPSTKAVAVAADSMGAEQNAYTSHQETAYFMQCAGSHLEKALDILSDMLFETKFKQEDIERERGVILEEINRILDSPGRQIWDDWQNLIFGNQPLGWPILGPPDNIRKFNQGSFVSYMSSFYSADRIIISIAGKIDGQALKMAEKYFGGRKLPAGNEWQPFSFSAVEEKPVYLRSKDTAQAHFILGVQAPAEKEETVPATRLLSAALGGGMSSRLFLSIREKQGLCYSVGSAYQGFSDAGWLGIYAGVTLDKIKQAVTGTLKECKKVANHGITKKELKKVKAMVEGQFALGLEDSQSVARFFGNQEVLYSEIKSPREILDQFQAVTMDDISNVAGEILDPRDLRLTIIGPYKDSSEFAELLHY